MNGNGKLLTITEASALLGVNKSTIYKYIEEDRISIENRRIRGKQIKHVKEGEITEVFSSMEFHGIPTKESERSKKNSMEFHENPQNLKESIKEVIENYFQDKETQLMKPLEEIATYKLGKIEAENQFLKERLDTLLQEITALPGPVDEVNEILLKNKTTLQEKEEQIRKLYEEKKELEHKQEQALKDQEARLKTEKEEQMKQLADAWKKELEQARRPWWKFW